MMFVFSLSPATLAGAVPLKKMILYLAKAVDLWGIAL
jgi:hypothetical protein